MKAIELKFLPDGSVVITESMVTGALSVVQNALVNLLSDSEQDLTFPDRGTDVLQAAVSGLSSSPRGAQHEANFAASSVLTFSQTHERATQENQLSGVELKARILGGGVLEMDASFRTVAGEEISFPVIKSDFET